MYAYAAEILRVVDGDTVWLRVDLGFDVHMDMSIRLNGLDAPEVSTQAGRDVRDWLREQLPIGKVVRLNTEKDRREKFGRYLGVITTLGVTPDQDVNVNELLLASGRALPYDGGKR
jgi:micrococcal nuclease